MKTAVPTFFTTLLCLACGSSSGADASATPDEVYSVSGYLEKSFLEQPGDLSWRHDSCDWLMAPSPQYGEFHAGDSGIVFNHTKKSVSVDPAANVRFHGRFGQMWATGCDTRGYAFAYIDVVLPLRSDGENVISEVDAELSIDVPDGSSLTRPIHIKFAIDGARAAGFFNANGGTQSGFFASVNYSGPDLSPIDRVADSIRFDPK